MLWLALHLPLLSLEAFCAPLDAAQRAGPVALLDAHRITVVNAGAAARGIAPGARRATALALAPEILLGQANAQRDALALQAVAHAALAFTPAVTLHGGQTVLLELQSCLRYWGGLPALLARLRMALVPLGHQVQAAAAPTALGAALLAAWQGDALGTRQRAETGATRAADERGAAGATRLTEGAHLTRLQSLQALLDGAPLWLLGPGREHWEALQGMGLQTLADLRALPRSGLARRFGAALLDDLDRARGERPDPRRWLALPGTFDSPLELFARADSSGQVLHGAAVLLARLVAWAQAQQGRISAFTLRMRHEPRHRSDGPADAPHTDLRIELAEPAADAVHLQSLLRERLARLQLTAPTLELRLLCHELVHAAAPNGELFPTRASEAVGLTRLLERLRARLGDEQVQRLQPLSDHRPERAVGSAPALAALTAARRAGPASTQPAGLPVGAAAAGSGVWPRGPQAGLHAGQHGNPSPGPSSGPSGGTTAGSSAGPHGGSPGLGPLPLHRPVWLLPAPQPLAERQSVPHSEGRPLALLSGPERIESGWWDGGLAVRDYFIAQHDSGALLWIYRSRLPSAGAGEGWFLHGRFG